LKQFTTAPPHHRRRRATRSRSQSLIHLPNFFYFVVPLELQPLPQPPSPPPHTTSVLPPVLQLL
ncbi:hypothetical protein SOVF_013660, partial [Spinacia oleracea]